MILFLLLFSIFFQLRLILNKLRLTVNMMKQVKAHYGKYPETPENFENWRLQTVTLFEDAKEKIVK